MTISLPCPSVTLRSFQPTPRLTFPLRSLASETFGDRLGCHQPLELAEPVARRPGRFIHVPVQRWTAHLAVAPARCVIWIAPSDRFCPRRRCRGGTAREGVRAVPGGTRIPSRCVPLRPGTRLRLRRTPLRLVQRPDQLVGSIPRSRESTFVTISATTRRSCHQAACGSHQKGEDLGDKSSSATHAAHLDCGNRCVVSRDRLLGASRPQPGCAIALQRRRVSTWR